jgi:oxygen-independent coproporphyrinogen-3 oxidase
MPFRLPEGEPVPSDGSLPVSAAAELGRRPFGCYVHVPFCAVRCGYCDFNTYTALELGTSPGASQRGYASAAIEEICLAREVLGERAPTLDTVFFGGGTPTLLPPAHLVGILRELQQRFGLSSDAEVTTEANPDSVTPPALHQLRRGGFTRISFGMQSAVPHVLAVLDRTHDPARVRDAVRWAREAEFSSVSLDLIYGAPGESVEDWQTTLRAAVALQPDHISAYALVIEDGTALARRVSRGDIPPPDDDDLADKYEAADDTLTAAGYDWYEVSNWAASDGHRCRHNLGYWSGGDWWGVGPGAHSHVGGVRWWNVKHPAAYADRLAGGRSPALAREVLDAQLQTMERVLLETRLADGLPIDVLDDRARATVPALVADDLVTSGAGRRIVLTRRGRLLADAVVRSLVS